MDELKLTDTTGRVELYGVKEAFSGFVIAEMAGVDENVGTSKATFHGDKYTYVLDLPPVCLNLDQPSAFNLVTCRLISRSINTNKPVLKGDK